MCSPPTNYPYLHCYRQGDTRTWTWNNTQPGETNTLTFLDGTLAVGDVIAFYDDAAATMFNTSVSAMGTPFDLAGTIIQSGGPDAAYGDQP